MEGDDPAGGLVATQAESLAMGLSHLMGKLRALAAKRQAGSLMKLKVVSKVRTDPFKVWDTFVVGHAQGERDATRHRGLRCLRLC